MNWQLAQVMPPYIPSTFIPQTNVPIYPQPLYINQLTSHFTYYNSHYAFMNNIASVLSQTLNTQFNKTFSFLNHQQNFIYKNYPINYENIIAYNRILTDISPTTLKTYQELSPILQIIIDLPEKDKKSILKALFHKISFRIDSLSKTVQKKINSILSIKYLSSHHHFFIKCIILITKYTIIITPAVQLIASCTVFNANISITISPPHFRLELYTLGDLFSLKLLTLHI